MKEVYVNSEHINTLETFLDLTPIVCGPIYLFILLLYKVLVHHLMRICARFFNSNFCFWLKLWVTFDFLGPYWAIFGVGVGLNNFHRVYSCSWTTFVFFVSFNSDIWFCLNFWVLFYFLGPYWAIFGFNVGLKNYFRVHLCSWTTFIFYDFVNFDIWFWLNFWVIL